ncbi:hypothetical protein L7F22_055012 [Adiantum nelumboides]|nr:hypothetical protein [Adiantum nelumboides]
MATLLPAAPASRPLKTQLASDEPLYNAFLCSFSPTLAKILGQVGYDYVVLDMEHGPGDTFVALPCMQALAAAGVLAIAHIAANDPMLIKKAMDLGPQGVMVPMIETTTDAKKAIASCQYSPRGNRRAAHPVVRASMYGLDISYLHMCDNDEVLKILQIESSEAVGRIPNIAAMDGVDCLMLGPTDLSFSIRYLHDLVHENVMKLMHRAKKAILSAPSITYLVGLAMPHDPPEEMRKHGYHNITGVVDLALFRNAVVADVKANKASLGMQELVSCDGTNYGCDGGEMDIAIASKSRGVSTTSSRSTRSSKKSSSDDEKIETDKEHDFESSDKEEGNQKGAEAKEPSKHEPSEGEDTSTPLDRKSKKPRSAEQVLLDEAMARVEAKKKVLADARAAKEATKRLSQKMTMEEARKARLEKAKAIPEEKRRIEVEQKAQEEIEAQGAQIAKEKEFVDLTSTIEHMKKDEREKHLEEQRAAQLAREKIKEALKRKAKEPDNLNNEDEDEDEDNDDEEKTTKGPSGQDLDDDQNDPPNGTRLSSRGENTKPKNPLDSNQH